ncbi:MAG: hypothetical protein ACC707_18660 [Thiohalomonadales bacterium]
MRILMVVVPSFILMVPALSPSEKVVLSILVALVLACSAYMLPRIKRSPFTLFVAASVVSFGMSIPAGTFELKSILVFGVTALIPFALMAHRNTAAIVPMAIGLCMVLFIPDLMANTLSKLGMFGRDADITLRSGEIVSRYGGIFGHPFVSGIISLFAFTFTLVHLPQNRLLAAVLFITCAILALVNADLAGSRRHVLLIAITAGVYIAARIGLPRLGFLAGLLLVVGVFTYEIGFVGTDEGNLLRAAIWFRSVETIVDNPLFGLGFVMPATSVDTFDPNDVYVTESFILSVGVWAGVPALMTFVFAMMWPVIKATAIRASLYDRWSIQRYAAYYSLYSALVLEFFFGGMMPSLFGAVVLGGLLGVLEPASRYFPLSVPEHKRRSLLASRPIPRINHETTRIK